MCASMPGTQPGAGSWWRTRAVRCGSACATTGGALARAGSRSLPPPAVSGSPTRSWDGFGRSAAAARSRPGRAREPRWTCVSRNPDQPVRVLVVDDHPLWRDGAARSLAEAGFVISGTAGNAAQALRVALATRPDVVLLDLNLPDASGAEVTGQLLAALPTVRVLMLSASGERQDVLDAVTAGASGYLLKSAELRELIDGVSATAEGHAVFTPRLVATGLTYPQIAERLTLSPRTVQNHVQNTLSKLQLHNKAQLVRYALERGVE